MQPNKQAEPSVLLIEEYFSTEDARFLECIRQVHHAQALATFADRWKKDPRPWARRQILDYLAMPLDCAGHEPVVKRLFKHAEKSDDAEIMSAFLVAFDQLIRRKIAVRRRWNSISRQVDDVERLVTSRDVLRKEKKRTGRNPITGAQMSWPLSRNLVGTLFQYRTRYYLRRRAWRFFRRLGYQHPEKYPASIAFALRNYTDHSLEKGVNILDSWGLLHACYGHHHALDIGATYIGLKEGFSLNDLTPAPAFADLWKISSSGSILLEIVAKAQSRLVRLWAMQLFRESHSNYDAPIEVVLRLLDHEEAEVQQFGAAMLEKSPKLATFTVDAWLQLLKTRNPGALQILCNAFETHVAPERLSKLQCMELACAEPVSVARLGLRLARQRLTDTVEDRAALTMAARAKCQATGKELVDWALSLLGTAPNYHCDPLIQFFDSLNIEVRTAAWNWLIADSPGLCDPLLWSRLSETPYEDLRLRIVDYAQRQWRSIQKNNQCLNGAWRSVILAVHRGGRQKVKAAHQVANTIINDPAQIDSLLPILAVAVRSVRPPECRAGLAAVLSIAEARPELIQKIHSQLPELKWEVPP